ncbi:ABC transporter G family member 15-like [Senna tora]|uniref:ABC transporter G family member 15-like n=1 Tax=Senna tora TaxID=362788 RepID=A0A834TD41_9FABA|nr:ABC transporter G family member 15-like [Senna tora]
MRKSIAWEDLTVEVPCLDGLNKNKKKLLLHSLTAFAYSHRIMALLGPSGSGKTTLLNSLAGTLPANATLTGNILINGTNRNLYRGQMSYVAQQEYFLGTLTVRETLTYSAKMRLVSRMTQQEISKVVQETIMQMGLEECADNQIGNWHLRGISNGEKKRLSIGLEILTQPDFLFLDEPTSGLDSASAFYVIRALSDIACGGKIVVCSIHQPSSEIFHLFDDLLLLSGGETVYFGEAKMALEFFANAGFPCPTRRNPSDHFLLCINVDFELIPTSSNSAMVMKTSEIRETLIESYKSTDNNSILARGKCISFIYGFMICLSCGGLPFFIEELKVFYGERSKGHYGEAVFVLSNILSSFPFLVLISLFSGTIIYYMVRFHPGLSHWAFFCINLFCCLSVVESCIMVVASVVPNVLMGIGTGTGVIVSKSFSQIFMMMSSPIFRPQTDIPKFFWRYPMSYLSFATWAVQGQYKNDMVGLEFDPLLPGDSRVKGEHILKLVFGVPLDHGKWWDLTALITLLLIHRMLLFFVLRFKNKSNSSLLWFYAKVSLHHFAARFSPSYNKPSISSKNQHAPPPLSSQEGLMSPNYTI